MRFNHKHIGTEHILLGLLKEESSVAASILKNVGVDLSKLRADIEKLMQSGFDTGTMTKLPQTPSAKKVIEYSMEDARSLSDAYVGTEHFLLGILRRKEDAAPQLLHALGLNYDGIREEVLKFPDRYISEMDDKANAWIYP